MSPTVTSIFASLGLDNLTYEQKVQLVLALEAELEASAPPGDFLTDELKAKLLRRQAAALADPQRRVSWEEVKAAARRRHSP